MYKTLGKPVVVMFYFDINTLFVILPVCFGSHKQATG